MTTTVEPLDVKKWHTSAFYREAVDSVVLYNSQLVRDAKTRLPYVDAQTGIAQSRSHLLHSRLNRKRGLLPGQVFSYPQRRWRRETRPVPPVKRELPQGAEVLTNGGGALAGGGLIQTLEGGVVTKRSSRIAGMSRPAGISEGGLVVPVVGGLRSGGSSVVGGIVREVSIGSEVIEEEESPDLDADYLDDYDSDLEERRSSRRKRRPPARTRTLPAVVTPRATRGVDSGDKPFLCSICNRRYKTSASLKAHCTQYHAGETAPPPVLAPPPIPMTRLPTPPEPTGPSVPPESRLAVPLPPPPNLRGKENAKPNPYCDFCLGDSGKNNKTLTNESMVSCANCGRSAHPSCMQFSPALAVIVHTYRWQCIECKSCHFCGTSENDDQLLFCDDCDRGFHMYCMKPPIKEPPEGNWSCGMCYKQNIL
ncbi:zinc finger protein ubi-d4 B-like [Halichondria panicea]|uniref:zinc finger protein ubi-d4 B-like n=1 Tax=Halichondria panicea TaxID=6063 RepID=UPI00312B54B0